MAHRYPVKDQVAIAGVATTPYVRDRGKSNDAMAIEACVAAVRDAGLSASDIDGIAGSTSTASPATIQSALGIPECRWWVQAPIPFTQQIIEGMSAVFSGACETVLAYHATYRAAGTSRSAARDPFRVRAGPGANVPNPNPDSIFGAVGYAAWASRYLHEYGRTREDLGLVAINNRSNATRNEHAALREPLTTEEYLAGRMVRDPLCVYDMDYPVDAADAFVITTAERARDLPTTPVLLHAAALGQTDHPEEDQVPTLFETGQRVVVDALRERSDIAFDDVDVYFPYDGFSIITLRWIESVGYCGPGQAPDFLREHWDEGEDRVKIDGRVPLNTHGGSLSEGGTQGSGHIREAVVQLRGEAGERQVPDAEKALVTPGGFFFNAGGLVLRKG